MYKLFKEDFQETNKGLIGLYLTTLISSLLVLISGNYKGSDVFMAIFVIGMGISTIGMIICIILPFVRFCLSFNNFFEKKDKKMYDAKVLSILLTIALSFVILTVSFVNTYSNHTVFKFVQDLMTDRHLAKNFAVFGVEAAVKMLFLYLATLTGKILSERSGNDKTIKSLIYTLLIVVFFHYVVKYATLAISFERKFILMIISFVIVNIILYLFGRYEYKKIKIKKNNTGVLKFKK